MIASMSSVLATEVTAVRVAPGEPCHQCEVAIADGLAWDAWHGTYCSPRCAAKASKYIASVPSDQIRRAVTKIIGAS
jgi:hypothetical protein